jgi:hypothetical protein
LYDAVRTDLAEELIHRSSAPPHKALNNHIKRGFGKRTAAAITEQDAIEFLNGLTCGPSTKSPYVIILRACWKFGKLTDNPWAEMKTERQDDRKMPEPFMRDEVEAILNGFKRMFEKV